MTTITDAFDLPTADQLTAMGFVVRLEDDAAAAEKLVDDYVFTPTVTEALPEIFGKLKSAITQKEDYGRFIHGSFGSGKSHFMGLLALLLEDHDRAWAKDAEAIEALKKHRGWVREQRPLVIRVHMLSQTGRDRGLDDALYRAFNRAMERHGKPACTFRSASAIYEAAKREAEAYGDAFYARLEADEVTDREGFEELAGASDEDLTEFAKEWLKARGADTSVMDMPWGDGLQKMAAHAKEQGFGAVVFLVDELLLWLGEKDAHEFRAEVNHLNTLVDHATGQRPVPVLVFVARQRNLAEFFPDLASDNELHAYIEHHSKRFDLTTLQDVELRHIVHGRVLKPKLPDAVAKARQEMADRHAKMLRGVLAGVDADYLRDVFPFHPALIEMLVDVSSLLQRERSALTLLYELLCKHYPQLPLGEFLPVGSAFAAIFPEKGMVESNRKRGELQKIHQAYWQRLRPAMQGLGLDAEIAPMVDQVVKSVLLAEVSPRLRAAGTTVEKLVQLNSAESEGRLSRRLYAEVYTALVELQRKVPDLQVVGTGKTANLSYDLGSVNFGELLARARAKADNPNQRLVTFFSVLKQELGLEGKKGFGQNEGNAGPMNLTWRQTGRRGFVKLGNVRTMSHEDLVCREDFRIIIDYPWDEPGHSVAEDRQRAQNARQSKGNQYTVCWLPRHFTPEEASIVGDVAAARYLMSEPGQEELLGNMGPQDRAVVQDRAKSHENQMCSRLSQVLLKAYRDNGECVALESGVSVDSTTFPDMRGVLEHLATRLLERRWPAHPKFLGKPSTKSLRDLLGWMVDASDQQGHSVHFDDAQLDALRKLGEPLDLVSVGQTRGTLRLDGRFLKEVLGRSGKSTVQWDPVDDHLATEWGLQKPVRDLFLAFLCQAQGYRARNAVTGELLEVGIGAIPASVSVKLQRANLLDHADWSRLRQLGPLLLGVDKPPSHRSVSAQDAAAASLQSAAVERRGALTALHEAVVSLGSTGSDRTKELQEALTRLAPLVGDTDSHAQLSGFLGAWPDDADDPVRLAVRAAPADRDALNELDRSVLGHLEGLTGNAQQGAAIRGHLDHLKRWVRSSEQVEALEAKKVESWNTKAHTLLQAVLGQAGSGSSVSTGGGSKETTSSSTRGGGLLVEPPPTTTHRTLLQSQPLDLEDSSALDSLCTELRAKLLDTGHQRVRLTVTVELDET